MKLKALLMIAFATSARLAFAETANGREFAPPACDFAVTFPIAPEVESLPRVAPGHVVTSAQTPGDYLPWLVAECTEMQSGTDSITAEYRESKNKGMLARMHATNITSSSTHDSRGDMTTTVGDVVIDGKAMSFTKLFIVGPRSILLVTALEQTGRDRSTKDRFFSSIVRKAL